MPCTDLIKSSADVGLYSLEINSFVDIHSTVQFFNDNYLITNKSKSKFLSFIRKQANKMNVMIGDTNIEQSQLTKFLGVCVDENLS